MPLTPSRWVTNVAGRTRCTVAQRLAVPHRGFLMRSFLPVLIGAICLGCSAEFAKPSDATLRLYGPFDGQFVQTQTTTHGIGGGKFAAITCVNSFTISGTVNMEVIQAGDSLHGSGALDGVETETGKSGDPTCPLIGNRTIGSSPTIATTASALTFSNTVTNPPSMLTASFTGVLSNRVVTGALTWTRAQSQALGGGGATMSNASATMNVTLREKP